MYAVFYPAWSCQHSLIVTVAKDTTSPRKNNPDPVTQAFLVCWWPDAWCISLKDRVTSCPVYIRPKYITFCTVYIKLLLMSGMCTPHMDKSQQKNSSAHINSLMLYKQPARSVKRKCCLEHFQFYFKSSIGVLLSEGYLSFLSFIIFPNE